MPLSSSGLQQRSGHDTVVKDGTEPEVISECSQGSNAVGCLRSTSDMANADIHVREECPLSEESSHGRDPGASPASRAQQCQIAFEEVALSMPEVPCTLGGSSKLVEHNFCHDWGTSAGKDWQHSLNELPDISSLDLGQDSSGSYMHPVDGPENCNVVPFTLQTSVGASISMSNTKAQSGKPEDLMISKAGGYGVIYPETMADGCFPPGNLLQPSNIIELDASTESLPCQLSNHQISESSSALASQSFYPPGSDMLESPYCQPFFAQSDDGALVFANEAGQFNPHQFNDLGLGNQEVQLVPSSYDGLLYNNDSANSLRDDGVGKTDQQVQPDQARESIKLAAIHAFCSRPSNNIQTCLSMDESPVKSIEQHDSGSLYYEPPQFPSVDIPFFICDLIQSGGDMEQEYSPLGICQLILSSMNCLTPFRLWDSQLLDDSPDAVLKTAAKTFTCTPSMLKKRRCDLLSPLPEKRIKKKLESDMNQKSFSFLTRDFSQLDVMFDENENRKPPMLSPSSNQKRNFKILTEDKENSSDPCVVGKDNTILLDNRILEKEFDGAGLRDRTKDEAASVDARSNSHADATAQTVQQNSLVLVEHKMNDLLFFSPDQFEIKLDSSMFSQAKTLGTQHSRKLEAALIQGTLSESSYANSCVPVVSSPFICRNKDVSHLLVATSAQSATSSTPLGVKVENSGNDAGVENLSKFCGTPFKRSMESPSAWKSPWFINSFVPGPRVDIDTTIEDIGYSASSGDGSYGAIGFLEQLSEHTATIFADAQEVLGNETLEIILKEICSNNQTADNEDNQITSQLENCSPEASNVLPECRVLDFSECVTPPGKGTESRKYSTAINFTSPSSYLLKGCR